MFRKNRAYFVFGILSLAMLEGVSLFYAMSDKTQMNLDRLNVDLAFGQTVGTLAALALALLAIGYSIKEADITIFMGDKNTSPAGVLHEIRVANRGNALGNVAHVLVEVEVPQSSPVSFSGAQGLNFTTTGNRNRKQYRLDQPDNPLNLYPAKYIFSLLGFIQVPKDITVDVTFTVQVVGMQGRTHKKFRMRVKNS
ncbi:MAG: hypothetical protein HYX81_04790 [Chloroflexi bacterium]|nr:hypothetical protein [Chloroflexota bacterium]